MFLPCENPSFCYSAVNASYPGNGDVKTGTEHPDLCLAVRLLCAPSKRPYHGRAGNSFNEVASPHCLPQVSAGGIVAGQTGKLEVVKTALSNVRSSDIARVTRQVRFTPQSGGRSKNAYSGFMPAFWTTGPHLVISSLI